MLRSIQLRHPEPRVVAFNLTHTAGAPTLTRGEGDASLTDNGTGDTTLTLKDPFARTPLMFVTPTVAIGDGSIGNIVSSDNNDVRIKTSDSAGSGTDGNCHVAAFGFDSSLPGRIKNGKFSLTHNFIAGILAGFTVDGTGTAAITSGKFQGTLTDNGTGDYSVALKRKLGQSPIVLATATKATAAVANLVSASNSAVAIKTFDAAGAAVDSAFDFIVIGSSGKDKSGKHRRVIECPQRKPRIELFRITVTAGTPVLTIGSGGASIVDNGVGDYTLTFTQKFARVPLAIANADSTHIVTTHPSVKSTTALQLNAWTNAGVAVDPGIIDILVLGYDTIQEF